MKLKSYLYSNISELARVLTSFTNFYKYFTRIYNTKASVFRFPDKICSFEFFFVPLHDFSGQVILHKQHIRNWLAIGLLLIFGAYYTNVTAFYHLHVINGVTYVHSHCHTPHHHDSGDGGHSLLQISIIAQLGQLVMTVASCSLDLSASYHLISTIGELQDNKLSSCSIVGPYLRAPPVLCM